MTGHLPGNPAGMRRDWAVPAAYERFEAFVAVALTRKIPSAIVGVLWRLVISAVTRERDVIQAKASGERDDRLGAG